MEEGIVKIGDYGLAKLIHAGQETGHSESIGTCHYMAPEIASGKYHKPIDIYAIGVILYEMLTGRVPFEGETVGEILMKHLTARPDLSRLPEPYRTIVARALAKDPAQRPGRVYELLPPEDAPAAGRRPVHRRRQGRAYPAPHRRRRAPAAPGRRPRKTRKSSGSAPRSRSFTSGPTRGRRTPGRWSTNGSGRNGPRPVAGRGRPMPGRPRPSRRGPGPPRRRCPPAESGSPSWPRRCSGPP